MSSRRIRESADGRSTRTRKAEKHKDNDQTTMPEETPNREFTAAEGWFVAVLYLGMIIGCMMLVAWVPEPLLDDAPATDFSEARAFKHTRELAEGIGERQVGTPGVEAGAQYLLQQAEEIAYLPTTRDDLTIEVERQQVSGAVNFVFLGRNITNAYKNLTNVVVRVTPAKPATRTALLVNAHFDSTIGTAGASDCASCVAVGLEALRVLVTDPSLHLAAPVVFLFNGGEETLMQAAHGFMSSSRWARSLGAFINLESTGPYGLPVMFQHDGAWAAATYAKSAKYPRGTSLSQDFFEANLIPADTDFKMFSSRYQGNLPGVDVAYVLGGSAYHTDKDVVDRIRPGTLQELGESVLGLVQGFTDELARRANGTSAESNERSAYYFDIGWTMVCYPRSLGALIHNSPMLIILTFPGQAHQLISKGMRNPDLVQPITYGGIVAAMFSYVCATVATIALPALLGVARVLLGGAPLIFFSQHWLGYLMFVPAAMLGSMLPFLPSSHPADGSSSNDLVSSVLGAASCWGLMGFLATRQQLGVAIYPFLWIMPVGASLLLTIKGSKFSKLLLLTASSCVAMLVSTTSAYTLTAHIMDKITLAGSHGGLLGRVVSDAVAGALIGAGTWLSLGTLGPAFAVSLRPVAGRVTRALALVSIAAALLGSLLASPYSVDHPKRIFCQHLHVIDPSTGQVGASHWVVATTDTHPMADLLSPEYRAVALPADETLTRYLYPLSSMLDGMVMPAPGPDPRIIDGVPSLVVASRELRAGGKLERIHFHLDTIKPCWGKLNITGPPLHAWSFTDEVTSINLGTGQVARLQAEEEGAALVQPGDGRMHIVRFAGNDGADKWDFWIDVMTGEKPGVLRMELTAMYLLPSSGLREFGAQFPEWSTFTPGTVYHADWQVAVSSRVQAQQA